MNPDETSGTTARGCRSHYGDPVVLEGRGDSGCNGGCAVVVFDGGGFNVAFEDCGERRMAVSISGTSQNTRAYHITKGHPKNTEASHADRGLVTALL